MATAKNDKTEKTEGFNLDALEEQMGAGREALTQRHGELKEELDKVSEQLRKIESYFNPVAIAPQPQPSKPRATGPRGPRKGKEGTLTAPQQILNLIVERRDQGIDSNEIAQALPDMKGHNNSISK